MAIGFARFKLVKRSEGKNSCQKSAYNSRSQVRFSGTQFQEKKTYNFKNSREETAYSEVILPDHVDETFKNREFLWNSVEQVENRKNSQVCWEMVFALPDDESITHEDRIELSKRFISECFVKHDVAVQLDIHRPKDGKNWHAHFLGTLRAFNEEGTGFQKKKIRGAFLPEVRNGRVVFSENFVQFAVDLQNQFFREKGYDIVVDPKGIVPQKHIGPQRFRGKSQSLIEENELRKEMNQQLLAEPKNLLEQITRFHSVFDYNTVEYFVQKIETLPTLSRENLIQEFWKQKEILPLFHRESGQFAEKYTTQAVVDEEREIFRNAERLKKEKRHAFSYDSETAPHVRTLSKEQQAAFRKTIEGEGLVCINGLAGTGKSTLVDSLRTFYEEQGYVVRGLAPDTAAALVLKEKGMESAENIHRFLFNQLHGNRQVRKGREVWFVDESSKIGNSSLKELLKVALLQKVKVVFTGDVSQFSPVERGASFAKFCDTFGSVSLGHIRRQEESTDREIVKLLSGSGKKTHFETTQKALDLLVEKGGFHWDQKKLDSIKSLVRSWAETKTFDPQSSSLIVALKKEEVAVLNDVVRLYRKECGELGQQDYLCKNATGTFVLSEGDALLFRRRSSEIGVENGDRGVVKSIGTDQIVAELERSGKVISFSPEEYSQFQLGYVSTHFGAQGTTVDHSFILVSPQMRLDAHYVAFSRHRKSAKAFVAREEISSVSALKKLAALREKPLMTAEFVTEGEWKQKEKREMRLHSSSLLKRTYGKVLHSVSQWDLWTRGKDLTADERFFRPFVARDSGLSIRVFSEKDAHPTRTIQNRAFRQTKEVVHLEGVDASYQRKKLGSAYTKIDLGASQQDSVCLLGVESSQTAIERVVESAPFDLSTFVKELHQEMQLLNSLHQGQRSSALRFEEAKLITDYDQSVKRCEAIRKATPSFFASSEWKTAVVERNQVAYRVFQELSFEEIRKVVSSDSLARLSSYKQKHVNYLAKNSHENSSSVSTSSSSKRDPLLQRKPRVACLPEKKEAVLKEYFQISDHARLLYEQAQSQAQKRSISLLHAPCKKEWFVACAKRNELACVLQEELSEEELQGILTQEQRRVLRVQGVKHAGKKIRSIAGLSKGQQTLLHTYASRVLRAKRLYRQGKEEAERREIGFSNTSVAKEFFSVSQSRNESAYYVKQGVSKVDLVKAFSEVGAEEISEYAKRYEVARDHQEKNSVRSLETELKSQVEPLCFQLFSDRLVEKRGSCLRFGTRGSLSVNVTGRHQGTFRNFETGEGGGLLTLIQHVRGIDFVSSLKYAREFLQKPLVTPPDNWKRLEKTKEQSSFVSVNPPQGEEPPPLVNVSPGLAKRFDEIARYHYRDQKGALLFSILRLEPKEGGAKQVRPLSFGFLQKTPENMGWFLRGYQSTSKAIYGLEKLTSHPEAQVLIVEGEKAADAANQLLSAHNYIALSWVGGAGAVGRVNWSCLSGREVTIWPDNDQAGFKASRSIVRSIRKHHPNSLRVVEEELLQKSVPEKWDLADPLPEGVKRTFVLDALRNATEKAVGLSSALSSYNVSGKEQEKALFRQFVGEILWRVEERLWDRLEREHGGKTWEIREKILKEMQDITDSKASAYCLMKSLGVKDALNERVVMQFLYNKAEKGRDLASEEVRALSQSLEKVDSVLQQGKECQSSFAQKIWERSFDQVFSSFRRCTGEKEKLLLQQQVEQVAKGISRSMQRELQRRPYDQQLSNELDR